MQSLVKASPEICMTSYILHKVNLLIRSRILAGFLGLGLFLCSYDSGFAKERPSISMSKAEGQAIRENLDKLPLLKKSFDAYKNAVESAMLQTIELPPPGEAGGYAHEKHKQNYREMQMAGVLFTITGDERYADFVKRMLEQYAVMYPTLGPHPRSFKQKPGRLFHQTLNEEVWLVNVAQAYDAVYEWLTPEDRANFEENIFQPMIHLFSVQYAEELDRIHNHGTWACAAVGMIAYVLDDKELVEKAILGTRKNGQGGFLRQLELLFSPDGYYMEGPYYIRYALRPFFLFAEAIERNEPERKIYEYRDGILRKAFYATAMTVYPNGVFPAINDASLSMDIADIGPTIAGNLSYYRYGADENLLAIAAIQDRVILNGAGLKVAEDFGNGENVAPLNWSSVELRDGHDGERGGLGILRTGQGREQTMLLMKYGVHGKGHGHFDKLHFIFYDQYRTVVPDYGFARWINMEPKFGGRYTAENNSFAKQTIAHNTVVVDQASQNSGKRQQADERWGERHFFDGGDGDVQAVSAFANDAYPGVDMQRTMLLVNDPLLEHPVVVDLFRLTSESDHQYDYPLYFNGQIVTLPDGIKAHADQLAPLGADNGYQHIWNVGSGSSDTDIRFSWFDGNRYYSVISAPSPGTEVFVGRTGANDPDFNLRSQQMVMLRRNAANHLFASVIEPHGYFNEAREQTRDARSVIQSVNIEGSNETASVITVRGKRDLQWQIMIRNSETASKKTRVVFSGKEYEWEGNYKLIRQQAAEEEMSKK